MERISYLKFANEPLEKRAGEKLVELQPGLPCVGVGALQSIKITPLHSTGDPVSYILLLN